MMIRHVPAGSGHPYTADTDQREPVIPQAGQSLRIGAKASADVTAVTVHLEETLSDGTVVSRSVECTRAARTSRGQAIDGGHLASAQARLARQQAGWEARFTVDERAVAVSYRLVAQSSEQTRRTRLFACDVARWESAADGIVSHEGSRAIRVVPGSVQALRTRSRVLRVRFDLPLAPGEHVSGFGERFDRLDHRGTSLDSVVFEQYKSQGLHRRTYMPMPFAHVVGGIGWGFHVKTSRRVWFDVGASNPHALTVEAETDAALGDPAVGVAVFEGDPSTVLDAFVGQVGRAQELPAWVFKLWASGNEWNTQAEVERQAALHREHRIPIGSVVIEAWSDESTFTVWRDASYTPRPDGSPAKLSDFTFPKDGAWPDPAGMIDALHAQDVKVILWQIPLIKMRPHPTGQTRHDADALIEHGFGIKERTPDGGLRPYRNRGWWFPLGLMPDFSNPDAAAWWTAKRRYLVEELGVDGFKTDGGEHAWGHDLVYHGGRTGAEANNLNPVAYAKAYGDLLKDCGKAPVTFSRAGFTGSQAHGAFWAGDENSTWEAFEWSLWAGLNASASGIVYWGWDIAGFSGPVPDAELYVRAFAASAFVPIMQYHSEFNHHRLPSRDRTPWNIAECSGDDAVIAEVRRIVELRERLIPYLVEQARVAIEASRPLMRPLFFDYPKDPGAWPETPQWLLGDDILVAPITSPGGERDVYLPKGEWVDAWTAQAVTGPVTQSVRTPRDRVPVYVKASAWPTLKDVFSPSGA